MTGGYTSNYYIQTQTESFNSLTSLGRGYTGDSGGGAYDSMGRTLGIIVAGTTGTQFSGQTTILRFDTPEVASFISSTIPSPGAGMLLLSGSVFAAMRRRRE